EHPATNSPKRRPVIIGILILSLLVVNGLHTRPRLLWSPSARDKNEASRAHCATQPPSTARGKPVTKDAASEHSHTTASPTSAGAAMRPMGSSATTCSSMPGLSRAPRSNIGVRIAPGHTALTRIPALAYSSAAVLVSPFTPCLAAT